MTTVTSVSTETFQKEVLESELPVVLIFSTDNCGPCEGMEPLTNDLADEFEGKLLFKKYNVTIDEVLADSNPIAKKYDVMGFPTQVVIKNGEVVKNNIGGLDRSHFLEFLEDII